jgi:hypothetical protein
MLNIIIGEQKFSIRNEFDELTIKEFELITNIINNKELDIIEQYHSIFLLLGVDEKSLDYINLENFMNIVGKWEQRKPLSGFTRTINVDGDEYTSYNEGDEFKFNLKIIRQINKISKSELTYSNILAVIFKDIEDCNTEECFQYKTDIFNNITCDIALPYIISYNEEIKNSLNSFNL